MELFAARRRRLLERIDGVAVLAATPVALRNNDVEHDYRADSDLVYFTGFEEPDAVLVLSTTHPEHQAVMFVRPRDAERELWDGARVGVDGVVEAYGVDAAYPIGELKKRLPGYFTGASQLYFELGKQPPLDDTVLAAIKEARGKGRAPTLWPQTIHHPELVWHELRVTKDDEEITSLRRAIDITAEAHAAVMAKATPGIWEYQIEAELSAVFRRNGSPRCAYATIVGSGANATVLHYHANDRQVQPGELVLVDAGCELNYSAADVTRTFPVDGTFSTPQRKIYEVVLDAQLAAIDEARPGSTIERIHEQCLHRLVDGMVSLGLLEGERDELIASEAHRRYYMHRTSHWLGMDVHDVGAYFVGGESRKLGPGMVLTIEPGIYVAADDEQAPAELRGIGVRIEDDMLVTTDGAEVLSAAIPKTIAEVERACRG
ncbi:MAG: aminopeptidase P N-terminal domain-containing protein [Deltaproteobacteria bacterium]|nr:aminopeptidase P N-terminal domain-containing protein [Deltaproteobacteria bacterium]